MLNIKKIKEFFNPYDIKRIDAIKVRAAQVLVTKEDYKKSGFVSYDGNKSKTPIFIKDYKNLTNGLNNYFFGVAVGDSALPDIKNGQVFIFKKIDPDNFTLDLKEGEFFLFNIVPKPEVNNSLDVGGLKIRKLAKINKDTVEYTYSVGGKELVRRQISTEDFKQRIVGKIIKIIPFENICKS